MQLEEIRQKILNAPEAFVRECEAEFSARIDALANAVAKERDQRPVVLLSGPSGSGKTTTANLIEARLDSRGMETHMISLDNYFRDFTAEDLELFRRNELDLESPDRVDGDLLSQQIEDLMRGRTVELPRYDFTTNSRVKSGKTLRLRPGELLVFEGIHALNPSLLSSSDDYTSRIYVSVRTRIEHGAADDRRLLHPSKVRLARRMIRDHRERGRSLSTVVDIYDSVERGENLYIMPHKHRADYDVDNFIPYELCLYKGFLPASLPEDEAKHPWLSELLEVLGELPVLDPATVPPHSLLREFVGK